ncbi:MAG: OmpA family protein [Nitrospirae bacterium]|nr:OmpA family protein [Nitrospirota bacterium]
MKSWRIPLPLSKNQQLIKIVRRSRKMFAHREGGIWKIAYADFITAVMIFFLSMWLLSMQNTTGKSLFSDYFKTHAVGDESAIIKMQYIMEREMIKRKENIRKTVEEKTAPLSVSDNLKVEVLDDGVRIQMMDSEKKSIFEKGSAKPTSTATRLFKAIADSIKKVPNSLTIEGHTDSVPYGGGGITNWELSTMRASAARIELEKDGIPSSKIDKIVGYADTRPLIKNDPADRRNRRISIFIAFSKIKMD